MERFNRDLLDFITESKTAFHAAKKIEEMLISDGFTRLYEEEKWAMSAGGKYYVVRNESAIIAFKLSNKAVEDSVWRIVGAHTDSPTMKIKPNPEVVSKNIFQLAIEPYGSMILATWFDRDLSIAGRVNYLDKSMSVASALIDFKTAVAIIPSLAIHLNRNGGDNSTINKQKELPPILMEIDASVTLPSFDGLLLSYLHNMGLEASKVLGHELFLYDTNPPQVVGLNNDFITGSRLDNLLSCFVGAKALQSCGDEICGLLVCNDHEECGSISLAGAESNFLKTVIGRICGGEFEKVSRVMARALMASVDNAHALHPNYPEKHEPGHSPLLNRGPVIKFNANQKYASNGHSSAFFSLLADVAQVPLQSFVARSDVGCGSTIGPTTSALLGVQTVDIGVPTLSMHSIRETAGT